MVTRPFPPLPPLAGVCTFEDAASVGWSVEESVRRLLRLHWAEKRLMEFAHAHLPATPEWEVKCALALQQWQNAEHAHALRTRIAEMRSPVPRLDVPPDAALDTFFEELLRVRDTVELVAGLAFTYVQLAETYRRHIAGSNPLVDHPTRRMLRFNLLEDEAAAAWCNDALVALLSGDDTAHIRADAWRAHLEAVLRAAGGLAGDDVNGSVRNDGDDDSREAMSVKLRSSQVFEPDTTPRRDTRFRGVREFEFPPQAVYNMEGVPADERNLALLCRRALEMDVPETMASFLAERRGRPWEFYREYARQLWDEARHAMMGTVGLQASGVDWTQLPLHVGFSLRLNLHAEPLERQILLYAIEQSLMPADTGKRYEYETARAAGDELSTHFHDFDWADEVLHAQIGRHWLKQESISREEAIRRGEAIHERTWAALAQYREPVSEDPWAWWPALVREVLGRESAAQRPDSERPDIVTSG
ncbi:hypothetical protein BH23GEM9_BH23GEM9_07750 [soil metagenome]